MDERDLLSRTTAQLRLASATYTRERVRPYAHRSLDPALAPAPGLVVVERGQGSVGFDTRLDAGDVLLVARPDPVMLEAGAAGLELVIGRFAFIAPDHPVLPTLPPHIHIAAARLEGARWAPIFRALVDELDAAPPQPGRETMLVRLSDVLVIEAMRCAPPPRGTECPAAATTAADDGLQRVLLAIHDRPHEAWTVASLADLAGQSRSAFAAHFGSVVGEPPMTYLARWRMFRARNLLRTTELSLDAIAAQVGYGSAAAFSLAFAREHGVAPGAFRREAHEPLSRA